MKENNGEQDLQISATLAVVRRLNNEYIVSFRNWVKDPELKRLAHAYKDHSGREFDPGLNLFTIISDLYRRENFHSDILALLLASNGQHKEGAKFLELFLDYLNGNGKGIIIDKMNYKLAVVERESSRIDISIKDPVSKRAIIIENKINNASDMHRQIPRYHEKLVSQGYVIDAVIYLVLSGNKQPETHDWSPFERDLILPKVIAIAAYDETSQDLFTGWLVRCETIAENIDAVFLLRQYKRLLHSIGGKNMNKPLMESFMKNMMINDNYDTAYALKDMLENLINYRRDKIIDYYKFSATPFTRVGDWNNYAVLNDYFVGDSQFSIDIIVTKHLYQVQFFDRRFSGKDDSAQSENPAFSLLKEIAMEKEFFLTDVRYEKQFSFPHQESCLYEFIDAILFKLRSIPSNNNSMLATT